MQFRTLSLRTTRVCRVCRSKPFLVRNLVSQPNSHNPASKLALTPSTVHSDFLVSSHHRRKVHLSAVIYAPEAAGPGMATSEIAFATGNENKLKEVNKLAICRQSSKV